MEKGVPIRSLSRGIAVLQAINRGGAISMMEIARTSGVPYPTACRLVRTLVHEGLVEREPARKFYRPTALVQTLSHGFQGHARLVQVARPSIVTLTRDVGWPISLATHVGHSMVIRDSTHSLTSLTFNAYFPGYTMPILESAAGLVFLSFCPEEERLSLLEAMKLMPDQVTNHMIGLFENESLAADIVAQGHATRAYNAFTRNPGKTSSIAVPIFGEKDRVVGTLSLAFFAAAMKLEDAVEKYLAKMQATARAISVEMMNDTNETVAIVD